MAQRQRKGTGRTGSGMKPFYLVLIAVAVIGVAIIAYAAARAKNGMATEPIDMSALNDPQQIYNQATPIVIGNENAPVKLVEFADYMCPGCGYFATQVQPVLEERFVKSGQLQLTLYDFPLGGAHVHSFLAARAARCAGDQGKFEDYHNLLFGRQTQWSPLSRNDVPGRFVDYAGELGLDKAAFQGCLESDKYADVVSANRRLGEELGVNQTPTVIINGRQPRNPNDIDEVTRLIEESLGGQTSAKPTG